jgi:hypothetical protein
MVTFDAYTIKLLNSIPFSTLAIGGASMALIGGVSFLTRERFKMQVTYLKSLHTIQAALGWDGLVVFGVEEPGQAPIISLIFFGPYAAIGGYRLL